MIEKLLSMLPSKKIKSKELIKSTYYWNLIKYTTETDGLFLRSKIVTYALISSNRSQYLEYKDKGSNPIDLLNKVSDVVVNDFMDAQRYLELISDLSDAIAGSNTGLGNNTDRLQAKNYARKVVTEEREILSEALLMHKELQELIKLAEEGLG